DVPESLVGSEKCRWPAGVLPPDKRDSPPAAPPSSTSLPPYRHTALPLLLRGPGPVGYVRRRVAVGPVVFLAGPVGPRTADQVRRQVGGLLVRQASAAVHRHVGADEAGCGAEPSHPGTDVV